MTTQISSVGRRRLFKVATLAIGLVVALIVGELALRIIDYSSPQFYEADSTLGYRLIPGMTGWYSREGRSYVEINQEGFRDVDHAVEKPADSYRIAVIGDSYVEALQVERGEMFTNFIAGHLGNCGSVGNRRVEVLSFGVSGYGTAQELLMLRDKVWKYSPDLVVLLVTTNNDITDNLREFKRSPIPYFRVQDGQWVEDDSFRDDPAFKRRNSTLQSLGNWLTNHLRLVQAVTDAHRSLKYRFDRWRESRAADDTKTTTQADTNSAVGAPSSDPGTDNLIYREPADDNWRQAWDITERLIPSMANEASDRHVRFVLALGSNGIQVWPDPMPRSEFAKRLGVQDLGYPNRRLVSLGSAHSFPVIDLVPELAHYAESNKVYLHGFAGDIGNGHWNAAGHKAAGDILGKQLCSALK